MSVAQVPAVAQSDSSSDQSGSDQGGDQSSSDQGGGDQSGSHQSSSDQGGSYQRGSDQSGDNQRGHRYYSGSHKDDHGHSANYMKHRKRHCGGLINVLNTKCYKGFTPPKPPKDARPLHHPPKCQSGRVVNGKFYCDATLGGGQ